MNDDINVDMNRKSIIVEEDDDTLPFSIDSEKALKAEKETESNIPSRFIPIKLPSNGRIEGIPDTLHFRDYSASEALDINTPNEEDKPKAIANVLTEMCYEHFDVSLLPVQDVLYILYVLQATFISNSITKIIRLDESLEEGTDEGCLDNDSNLETIEIPISSLTMRYLGKDSDDKDIKPKIKVPFKIVDRKTGVTVKFKMSSLKDIVLANNYCKDYFSEKLMKFSSVRKSLSEINSVSNETQRNRLMNDYLDKNYELCKEYYSFTDEYSLTVAKIVQCLQIVEYDGNAVESIDDKWKIYQSEISASVWKMYNNVIEKYQFGLNNEVEVYSNKLNKKLVRSMTFQLSDFLSLDRHEDDDRYCVLFE